MLEEGLAGTGCGSWSNPRGGYFVSFDAPEGTAKHAFFIQRDSDLHSLSTSLFPKESNLYTICLYSIVDNVDNFPGVSGYFPTIIPEVAATLSGNKNSSP